MPADTLRLVPEDGKWVALQGATRAFTNVLQHTIKPTEYRRYDREKRAWLVYAKALPMVVEIARSHYNHVDWSTLPPSWQMYIVGGKWSEPPPTKAEQGNDPYGVLYLKENAPIEVIRAAHKALSQIHHPDKGGSHQKMAEINEAYEVILKSL